MSFGSNAARSLKASELRKALSDRNIDASKYLALIAAKEGIDPAEYTLERSIPFHELIMSALDIGIEAFLDELVDNARRDNIDIFAASC